MAKSIKNAPNKKTAIISIARKLLVLIYIIWKNDIVFIQDYEHHGSIKIMTALSS